MTLSKKSEVILDKAPESKQLNPKFNYIIDSLYTAINVTQDLTSSIESKTQLITGFHPQEELPTSPPDDNVVDVLKHHISRLEELNSRLNEVNNELIELV